MRPTPTDDPKRFDTDRDVLPFPAGGVFAGQRADETPDKAPDEPLSSSEVAGRIMRELDAMQANIDALAEALDEQVIPFTTPDEGEDDDRWPAA